MQDYYTIAGSEVRFLGSENNHLTVIKGELYFNYARHNRRNGL